MVPVAVCTVNLKLLLLLVREKKKKKKKHTHTAKRRQGAIENAFKWSLATRMSEISH